MFQDWIYEEATIELSPGDLVLAYTDGVTEATNPLGEEWGVEGLRRVAAKNRARSAEDVVDAIFNSMDEFTNGRQTDDATIAVLRVH